MGGTGELGLYGYLGTCVLSRPCRRQGHVLRARLQCTFPGTYRLRFPCGRDNEVHSTTYARTDDKL